MYSKLRRKEKTLKWVSGSEVLVLEDSFEGNKEEEMEYSFKVEPRKWNIH